MLERLKDLYWGVHVGLIKHVVACESDAVLLDVALKNEKANETSSDCAIVQGLIVWVFPNKSALINRRLQSNGLAFGTQPHRLIVRCVIILAVTPAKGGLELIPETHGVLEIARPTRRIRLGSKCNGQKNFSMRAGLLALLPNNLGEGGGEGEGRKSVRLRG